MADVEDWGEDDPILEYPNLTRWAVLVNLQDGRWLVSRVSKTYEVGECEIDMSRRGSNWYIGAFFDSDVDPTIDALRSIGGNSMEGNSQINDLLTGTIRSFLRAQENLKKWQVEPPKTS